MKRGMHGTVEGSLRAEGYAPILVGWTTAGGAAFSLGGMAAGLTEGGGRVLNPAHHLRREGVSEDTGARPARFGIALLSPQEALRRLSP